MGDWTAREAAGTVLQERRHAGRAGVGGSNASEAIASAQLAYSTQAIIPIRAGSIALTLIK